jgi:DNA-binding SARP family transcriptional activator
MPRVASKRLIRTGDGGRPPRGPTIDAEEFRPPSSRRSERGGKRKREAALAGAANHPGNSPRPPVAKIARPGADALLHRERLFERLDAARAGTLAWLSAPCGAGKTSLVASWLEARGLRALWLCLDAGDADPAAFFGYLALAGRGLGVSDLPAYRPSAAAELPVFARRFGERLFAAAGDGIVLVLDDFHALPPDAPVHAAIGALLGAVPRGAVAIVASRNGPPVYLGRRAASAGYQVIDWATLRLTPAEGVALARRHGVAPEAANAIAAAARGWAAGIVLLARVPDAGRSPPDAAPEMLFDYFATEVFGAAPAHEREFLLRAAFLPAMTPDLAARVTGEPRAAELLDALHRAQRFTERRAESAPVYEFHPLFRQFLQREAARQLDAQTLRGVRASAAAALADAADPGAAVALLAANEDWAALAGLVRAHADRFAAFGRHATVARWIEAIPAAVRAQDAWLGYWLGRCRLAVRQPGARALLAEAGAAFERDGDAEGALASCAWLLRSSTSPEEAARWVATAERIATAHPSFDDPTAEARVIAQFLLVHQFPPHHPLIARFAARAEALSRTLEDVAARTRMAAFALSVPTLDADLTKLAALCAETAALAAREDAPPGDLATLLFFRGYGQIQFAEAEAAAATIARMERLAAATGSIDAFTSTWFLDCRAAVVRGEVARARESLDRLRQAGGLPVPIAMHVGTLAVYVALLEGNPPAAVAEARAVLDSAGHVLPDYRPLWHANLGQALLALGDVEAALHELEAAVATARSARLEGMRVSAQLLCAAALLRRGDTEGALVPLREALAAARSIGCVPHLPFVLPATLSHLAAAALGHGIEREFVRRTIASRGLPPPDAEEERWPWRVRVRALGAFELSVDGAALDAAAKPQRKPIELLKYVIASGGRDVGFGAVTQALWPDAEGDAAKRSFDVTLHRLRRLLGCDDAITLHGGKLALNPGMVWVDALAFERLAGRVEELPRGQRAPAALPVDVLERALRLYRGPLLASDDEPWIRPARQRLRRRFVELAEAVGERWEGLANLDAALAWYHRAADVEPTAERIHQRILRLLHRQGRRAEALAAYDRCREVLVALVGAGPSPETEALLRLLHG